MNKEEFVRKLKIKLDILEDDVFNDEINYYLDIINTKQNENQTEEEIIKSFGNINDIAKKILEKHGINSQKVLTKSNFVTEKFAEIFDVIQRVINAMSKNKAKENIKIIIDILILLLLISLIKIPFILIQNLGDSILLYLENPLIVEIWALIVDLLYILVAIITFVNIFTKWFKNIKINNPKKTKDLESITLKEK